MLILLCTDLSPLVQLNSLLTASQVLPLFGVARCTQKSSCSHLKCHHAGRVASRVYTITAGRHAAKIFPGMEACVCPPCSGSAVLHCQVIMGPTNRPWLCSKGCGDQKDNVAEEESRCCVIAAECCLLRIGHQSVSALMMLMFVLSAYC